MLVNELGEVVDLVVDDHVQVILGVVLRNVRESEFGRHLVGCLLGLKAERKGSSDMDSGFGWKARRSEERRLVTRGRRGICKRALAISEAEEKKQREKFRVWTGSRELCKSRTARVEPVPSPEKLVSKLTPAQVRG